MQVFSDITILSSIWRCYKGQNHISIRYLILYIENKACKMIIIILLQNRWIAKLFLNRVNRTIKIELAIIKITQSYFKWKNTFHMIFSRLPLNDIFVKVNNLEDKDLKVSDFFQWRCHFKNIKKIARFLSKGERNMSWL